MAYDYNKTETGNHGQRQRRQRTSCNGRPSYFVGQRHRLHQHDTDPQYALKLTWNISPNHKLSFTCFGNNDKFDDFRNLANPSEVGLPVPGQDATTTP